MSVTGRNYNRKIAIQNVPVRTEGVKELRNIFLSSQYSIICQMDFSAIEARFVKENLK